MKQKETKMVTVLRVKDCYQETDKSFLRFVYEEIEKIRGEYANEETQNQ